MQTSLSNWLKKAVLPQGPSTSSITDQPRTAALPTPPPEPLHANARPPPCKPSDLLKARSESSNSGQVPDPHPNITIQSFTKSHISPFKCINSLLLPIPYSKSFYDAITSDPLTASVSLVALWHDDPIKSTAPGEGKVIGGIRCRILTPASSGTEKALSTSFSAYAPGSAHRSSRSGTGAGGEKILYVSTLTLLAPYRGLGVANALLERVERVARDTHGVTATGAHVWVANEEGLEWYRRRGFREVGREGDYYRRLDPMEAVVMQREIAPAG